LADILVADDEPSVAEFVRRVLEHRGHRVSVVEDGLKAVDALSRGRFDLLLSDIVMPGLDGIALALKATKDYPDMRIVLMSGYALERQRAHNLEVLAQRVVAKPFTLVEILSAVDEALAAASAG